MISLKRAAILLHEIYGVNDFMDLVALRYRNMGFQVFIYDMLGKKSFSYDQADEAYRYFNQKVGFSVYETVKSIIKKLKHKFESVVLVGFSVGATVAWRCCESPLCDGIICYYGSRIRDYSEMTPICPVLAVFAEQDSFDVYALAKALQQKPQTHVFVAKGVRHGFLDPHSPAYNESLAKEVLDWTGRNIEERIFSGTLADKRR